MGVTLLRPRAVECPIPSLVKPCPTHRRSSPSCLRNHQLGLQTLHNFWSYPEDKQLALSDEGLPVDVQDYRRLRLSQVQRGQARVWGGG